MDEQLDWEQKRGASEYRCGRGFPPRPYDEHGVDIYDDPLVFARWAGYMMARAKYLIECERVRRAIEDDPDDDPRPPSEMPIAA